MIRLREREGFDCQHPKQIVNAGFGQGLILICFVCSEYIKLELVSRSQKQREEDEIKAGKI